MLISFESAAVVSRLRLGMQRLVNLLALGVLNPFLKLREIVADKAGFGNAETYLNNQTDLVPVNLPEPPDSQQEMANYQPLIFRQNQRNFPKN